MFGKRFGTAFVLTAALAVAPWLAGCASKGYVNSQLDQLRQEQQTDIAALKTDTAQLRNSTQDAMARAKTAADDASQARDLALGKAGLQEIDRYAVFFKFNSDKLSPDAIATLDKASREIGDHPEAIVDVYGFADPTGPDRYNLDLGERRAQEVVRYLAAVTPGQLSRYAAVSYGERDLKGMSADSTEHSKQRRVVVSLIHRIPLTGETSPSASLQP
jgi:outer membrane protein OmpA-like peptidoglycan-associated protein